MKFKKILIIAGLLTFGLCGCNKDESKESESADSKITYDTITSVEELSFQIPSQYRKNAMSVQEYESTKVAIDSNFDEGVVENVGLESYQLTDYKTYLFNYYSNAGLSLSLEYVNKEVTVAELFSESDDFDTFSVTGGFNKGEKDGLIKISSDVTFSVVYENGKVSEEMQGQVVLIQYKGKQYVGLFGVPAADYNDNLAVEMINAFNYTGEESSLLGETATRTPIAYHGATENEAITVQANSMWQYNEDATLQSQEFDAKLTVTIVDSGVNKELSESDLYTSFSPEATHNNVNIVWNDGVTGNDGQVWVSKVFEIEEDGETYYDMIYVTSKGRTVVLYDCVFSDYNKMGHVNRSMKDLAMYSTIDKHIALNDKDKKKNKKEKTEENSSAEETTEASTGDTSTETTTEVATEQPTTEQPTTETPTTQTPTTQAPTTEATTRAHQHKSQAIITRIIRKTPRTI